MLTHLTGSRNGHADALFRHGYDGLADGVALRFEDRRRQVIAGNASSSARTITR
jgi:hypothetical protein